ncbi:PREDICTED: cyclin-dependent kinase inhibitor 1 [Tarenaya hassleriana]|uniref:cyclin-dependent kinase inhibitor 1 n=1 Tax=Tarenaya hassleriana TaxID=28532 RepID=UPI00053C3847|nr:PREDICTED: cyclin-dependent kinase inhibitor 1 [Tarenaya hassleriana]
MVRKCGGATEAGGGRARRGGDRADIVGEAKRRKIDDGGGSVGISSTYMQLRSRRILLRNSVSRRTVNLGCGSENPSSAVHDGAVSSSFCCHDYETSGSKSNVYGYVDLEEDKCSETETSACGSQPTLFIKVRDEESTESMGNSFSTIKSADTANTSHPECCRRAPPSAEENEKTTVPTEAELEEFFSAAEKQHHEKYSEKYNFDFLKEKPCEGRYEWVKLSQ